MSTRSFALPLVLLTLAPALLGGVPHPLDRPYFPPITPGDDSWETVDPVSLGWDPIALRELYQFLDDTDTQGFVALHAGRIMIERYYDGWDLHSTQPIYSATKSVTATQLGRLQSAGLLDLDDPVSLHLGLGWSNATLLQELQISIRDVASMASGLDEDFNYVAPPGQQWSYNTQVYRQLLDVIESATGLTRSEVADAILWTPIGMQDTSYTLSGEFMKSSPRDLARFGLMISRDGTWNQKRIVGDPAYLDEMLNPSQTSNPAYGLLWWLNDQSTWTVPNGATGTGPVVPSAPKDTKMALGAFDQKIYVVPSLNLVITRLGGSGAAAAPQYDELLWQKIKAAAPQ